ncbi:MAG: type II toxin-antitoxin system HicA family toxin [Dorea sp.]|nr:type II toxin-antitoxin system HicA family toxin [Dorea sp.]
MKRRDLIKKLESAGYRLDRDDGGHTIYEKDGSRPVQVPRHREINENTAKSILKAAGLK